MMKSFFGEKFAAFTGRVETVKVGLLLKWMASETIDLDAIILEELLANLLPASQPAARKDVLESFHLHVYELLSVGVVDTVVQFEAAKGNFLVNVYMLSCCVG